MGNSSAKKVERAVEVRARNTITPTRPNFPHVEVFREPLLESTTRHSVRAPPRPNYQPTGYVRAQSTDGSVTHPVCTNQTGQSHLADTHSRSSTLTRTFDDLLLNVDTTPQIKVNRPVSTSTNQTGEPHSSVPPPRPNYQPIGFVRAQTTDTGNCADITPQIKVKHPVHSVRSSILGQRSCVKSSIAPTKIEPATFRLNNVNSVVTETEKLEHDVNSALFGRKSVSKCSNDKRDSDNIVEQVTTQNTSLHKSYLGGVISPKQKDLDKFTNSKTKIFHNSCQDKYAKLIESENINIAPKNYNSKFTNPKEENPVQLIQSNDLIETFFPDEYDIISNCDDIYKLKRLSAVSPEYQIVSTLFRKGTLESSEIVKLERIVNPYMLAQYMLKKGQLQKYRSDVEEILLFHGANSNEIHSICRSNFDYRVYQAQAAYFSPYSSFANRYCNEDDRDRKVMLMCKVLFDRHSKFGKSVLIKYQDDHFYPEYKITYRV